MDRRTALIILILAALIVLGFKLFFSLQEDSFTEASYFNLRQAEHISKTGKPMFDDELSYQGRSYTFLPAYHYLLAIFSPVWMKIISNLLVILSSILVYLIVEYLVKDKTLSLFAGIISLVIPSSIAISNSALSVTALFIPLYLFFILAYLQRKKWSTWPMIITLALLLVTSALTIFIVIGLAIFILLQRIQDLKPNRQDLEIVLFSIFLTVWFYVIIFKDVLIGWSFLWGNTPSQLIFHSISATDLFSSIGMLPLLFALIGANKTFSKQSRNQLFVASMAIIFILCTIFGMVQVDSGLVILGFTASIIAGIGLREIKIFFSQSKYSLKKIVSAILVIFFATTTILPFLEANVNQQLPSSEKIRLTSSLDDFDGTILTSPAEANFVMYYSGQRTYYDDYYPFSNAQERHDNALVIYRGNSVFDASKILSDQDIDYIYLSNEGKSFYRIDNLKIASLGSCIDQILKNEVIVYENQCIIS